MFSMCEHAWLYKVMEVPQLAKDTNGRHFSDVKLPQHQRFSLAFGACASGPCT